jgi:hypothetical protein
MGARAGEAETPNSITAETKSNGFNMIASSVADESYRADATDIFSRKDYRTIRGPMVASNWTITSC